MLFTMKKLEKSQLEVMANYFYGYYKVSTTSQKGLKLNSTTYSSRQFSAFFTKNLQGVIEYFGGKLPFYSMLDEYTKGNGFTESVALDTISDAIYEYLTKKALAEHRKTQGNMPKAGGSMTNKELFFDYTEYRKVMDAASNQEIMVNVVKRAAAPSLCVNTFDKWLKLQPDEVKEAFKEQTFAARVDYNPYREFDIVKEDFLDQNILHINAHIMPKWRKEGIGKGMPLPEDFKRLMEHLFPNELCREYVYSWAYNMLASRNHTYLLLHGEQGVGKNTLVYVFRALVGLSNYVLIGPDFWDSKFTGPLKYKRLAFFDETIISQEIVSKVRSITNSEIVIEDKGVDPIVVDNFCSYVITNNTDKVNHVTYDDRRYSVPVLTSVSLTQAFGQEWADELYAKLEQETLDLEFIGAIGHWILENGKSDKFNEMHPYKSDAFYDIVDKSLSQWQKNIVELIETRMAEEYNLNDLRDELRGTGRVKLQGFLSNHRDREGDEYGFVYQKSDGARVIIPSLKYMPDGYEPSGPLAEKFKEELAKNNTEISDDYEF